MSALYPNVPADYVRRLDRLRQQRARPAPDLADPVALAERAVQELPEVEQCWRPVVERFAALAKGEPGGRTRLPLLEG